MTVIDDYLKDVTPGQKEMLEHVRELVKEAVPQAEEVVSYRVPAFKANNLILIYMAAFKDHMSLYPASDEMIKEIGPELAGFRTSKGTLRFTEQNPIPDDILRKIIAYKLKTTTGGRYET